jgi:DNA polymerase-1
MLVKALDEIKPTHLAIVFDHPGPSFRHLMYVGYQTNREKDRQIFEDIYGQIDKLKIIFEKVGTPVFQVEGFEADDVIGTIGSQAQGLKDTEIIIITGDRDLMQLVNDKVNLYMPIKGMSDMQIIDRDKVKDRLGVYPEQVIDYKALVGDSSDNYPGVQGIGPKTAVELIEKFGSFENIYTTLDSTATQYPHSLKGFSPYVGGDERGGIVVGGGKGGGISESIIKKLTNGYESGELSKRLATIKLDVPVTFNSAKCQVPSAKEITDVLLELGYKNLVKRIKTNEDSLSPRLF